MSHIRRDWTLLLWALGFELAIGLAAVGLAWWLDVPLSARLRGGAREWSLGVGVGGAMFLVLLLLVRLPFEPLQRLSQLVRQLVESLFARQPLADLALLSAAAGVGEELLFRGFLQQWLAGHLPSAAAIALASLAFGLVHPITLSYAVLATAFGAVMGSMTAATGSLLPAIVAHGLYDFLALWYFARWAPSSDRALHEEPDAAAVGERPEGVVGGES